jgi:hypothetical protein
MKIFSFLTAAIAGLFLTTQPAEAGFTLIYYSAPERVYGWSAGYNSNRAHNSAGAQCAKQGGTACKAVVECSGYGAVAYAETPLEGFGAGCAGDASSARRAALVGCIVASNGLCWTEVSFTPNGKTIEGDRNFDRTYFAQMMLELRGLYKAAAMGDMNAETANAVSTFQERIGRPRTGIIDDELVHRLLDATRGSRSLARIMKQDILPSLEKALIESGTTTRRMFSVAPVPAKPMTFSEDLMARAVPHRRLALATFLSASGQKCTLPAKDVQRISGAEGVWTIDCNEASYTLILHAGHWTIMKK